MGVIMRIIQQFDPEYEQEFMNLEQNLMSLKRNGLIFPGANVCNRFQ